MKILNHKRPFDSGINFLRDKFISNLTSRPWVYQRREKEIYSNSLEYSDHTVQISFAFVSTRQIAIYKW